MTALPIIDLAPAREAPSSAAGRAVAVALREACHSPGFCYVVGHGVDPAVDAELFEQMRRFFALDESARREIAIEHSAAFRGYTVTGDERTNGRVDWRDQLDFGPEQSAPTDPDGVPAWHRLRGPNQWPAALPSLAPAALAWMDAVTGVGLTAIRALAAGLGLPPDHFDHMFVPDSDVHAKLIRYPAADTDQGVGTHHDSGLLTFIAQAPDQREPGLQVVVDGGFVDAPPVPNAYVMNLGEMMQRASGGYLRATPHRVVSPRETTRLSAALFFNPRFDVVFEPLPLAPEFAVDTGAVADDVDVSGEPILASFGENNLKVRLRSHPDVAARHYADVVSD